MSADLLDKLAENLKITAAHLFCNPNEKIYDDNIFKKFDWITEKHLIKAMEGIKDDIRQDNTNQASDTGNV